MALITKTKMQAFFGSVIALIVLVVFAAVAAAKTGNNIPGLNLITDAMGIPVSAE